MAFPRFVTINNNIGLRYNAEATRNHYYAHVSRLNMSVALKYAGPYEEIILNGCALL